MDVVALVIAVVAVRVKPVVLEVGAATAVVVFCWSPNRTNNSNHVMLYASRWHLYK
jgi:hypothetical protein